MLMELVVRTLAIMVTAAVVPGVNLDGWLGALTVAVVLGVLNTFVRPVILILTLPVNVLTLGLFTLVINTSLIMLAGRIIAGFEVASFSSAFWFGVVLWLVNSFLSRLEKN